MHDSIEHTLLLIGAMMLLGLLGETLGKRTQLPRVTILIGLGLAVGPLGLAWLPSGQLPWFDFVATVALTMIGFLLGGKFTGRTFRLYGKQSLWLAFGITVGTFAVVCGGMVAVGIELPIALVLAGVSLATDPVATLESVEDGGFDSPLLNLLSGIVAMDDMWGLVLFGLVMTAVGVAVEGSYQAHYIWIGLWEMFGGIGLGIALGLPMAALSGRINKGKPMLLEALAAVFCCAGLSLMLEVSYLLAAITMGVTVAQLARHHHRPFHEVAHIEWPFLVLFLVLVGASFAPTDLAQYWPLAVAYILLRVMGRVLACWVFGRSMAVGDRGLLGMSLLPQAGVALGTALYAKQHFPELSEAIITVTVAATIFFEIVGPISTRWALKRYAQRHMSQDKKIVTE